MADISMDGEKKGEVDAKDSKSGGKEEDGNNKTLSVAAMEEDGEIEGKGCVVF